MSQAKTLNEQEIKQVLDYVSTKKYAKRDRALILTSHLSGMRVGEIASLTVGHVLDQNGKIKNEIRLTAEQTKGKPNLLQYSLVSINTQNSAYLRSVKKLRKTASSNTKFSAAF
jgi:integrase/recombinase XerD